MKDVKMFLIAVAIFVTFSFAIAYADSGNDAPTTPATEFHGTPANNPGHDGATGQPNGGDPGNSNGIHNVGQDTGTKGDGVPNACDHHGGLEAANKNC